MRKFERLALGAVVTIIGIVLLPIEMALSCVITILEWISGTVYVITGNNALGDKVAEWHDGVSAICRAKPFG